VLQALISQGITPVLLGVIAGDPENIGGNQVDEKNTQQKST